VNLRAEPHAFAINFTSTEFIVVELANVSAPRCAKGWTGQSRILVSVRSSRKCFKVMHEDGKGILTRELRQL
jgi:hypothetical protein